MKKSKHDKIIECVPNFSEGRDAKKVQEIVDAIAAVPEVKVLHVDVGYDANRTVVTFVGTPKGIEEAAFVGIKKASELIDMQEQKGTHPRLGATDVMPIIPIEGVNMEEAKALSFRLSHRVAEELGIPVYSYEKSAKNKQRQRLEIVRKGEYEALEARMKLPEWQPDYGATFNAKSGASIIGARQFLLAYNVNLATQEVKIAQQIAKKIRESGTVVQGVRQKGCFKGVKAIGWKVPEYNLVQVSTNITDTTQVGMHDVYEQVKHLARQKGISTAGSELIGLTPQRCVLEAGQYYSGAEISSSDKIKSAIRNLGLDSVVAFDPKERIIEYLL